MNGSAKATAPVKGSSFYFDWTIENFLSLKMKCGEQLESPIFTEENHHSKWCICLYPYGKDADSENEYISLFLSKKSQEEKEFLTNFEMHIINSKKEKTVLQSLDYNLKKKTGLRLGKIYRAV